MLVDTKSDGAREESSSSKEDILKIYFNQNCRARREKVRREGSKGWQGNKRCKTRLGMIPILILALLAIPFWDYYVMDTLGIIARPSFLVIPCSLSITLLGEYYTSAS